VAQSAKDTANELKSVAKNAGEWTRDVAIDSADRAKEMANQVKQTAYTGLDKAQGAAVMTGQIAGLSAGLAKDAALRTAGDAQKAAKDTANAVTETVSSAVNMVEQGEEVVVDSTKAVMHGIERGAEAVVDSTKAAASGVIHGVERTAEAIVYPVKAALHGAEAVASGVAHGIERAGEAVVYPVKIAVHGAQGVASGVAHGIERTGRAVVDSTKAVAHDIERTGEIATFPVRVAVAEVAEGVKRAEDAVTSTVGEGIKRLRPGTPQSEIAPSTMASTISQSTQVMAAVVQGATAVADMASTSKPTATTQVGEDWTNSAWEGIPFGPTNKPSLEAAPAPLQQQTIEQVWVQQERQALSVETSHSMQQPSELGDFVSSPRHGEDGLNKRAQRVGQDLVESVNKARDRLTQTFRDIRMEESGRHRRIGVGSPLDQILEVAMNGGAVNQGVGASMVRSTQQQQQSHQRSQQEYQNDEQHLMYEPDSGKSMEQTDKALDQICEAAMHPLTSESSSPPPNVMETKKDLATAVRGEAPIQAAVSLQLAKDVVSSSLSSSTSMMITYESTEAQVDSAPGHEQIIDSAPPKSKGKLRSMLDRAKGLFITSPEPAFDERSGQGNEVGGIAKDVVLGSNEANTPHDAKAKDPKELQTRMESARHRMDLGDDNELGVFPQGREIGGLSNEAILGSRNARKPNDGVAKSPEEIKARAGKLKAKL
jgi:hypothetical protein